jgi:hypothetical protein
VQPGFAGGDPLSALTVSSAKQWKAMSNKITVNLEGIELQEKEVGNYERLQRRSRNFY